ncbi:MAG: HEPN domain-containing protein [Lewinellaceae bacterium]|nr:HEPN domain-containing protein [Lewinellaceae bacterium]
MNTSANHSTLQADLTDAIELEERIKAYRRGSIEEERFKHFRLTRGVYGQRQLGVHMFRTKLPLGRITSAQLAMMATLSDRYATGNLHLTTRQNIQFHYVKLESTPAIWEALASVGVNAREACGNTVRNITASPFAGIDPEEPFDVSPYALAIYNHFLRNPVCQEMGRKVKMAFSSSVRDTAYGYFHDFGFIPLIQDGIHGFKVVIGGGLGAQAIVAETAFDYLPADQIISFTEAAVRVFDRLGEREKRYKARMKYLVQKLGKDAFLELIQQEMIAVSPVIQPIDTQSWKPAGGPEWTGTSTSGFPSDPAYETWLQTNVYQQKNNNRKAVGIKIRLGDLSSEKALLLAQLIPAYAADDVRITVTQDLLLREVHADALPSLFHDLRSIGLADPGFNTILDVTACPGTDTCNLGVTNSTAISHEIEAHLARRFPLLVTNRDIQIKISGCMNSCGQHMAAQIGLHGSSIKVGERIVPAMQLVLGGGLDPSGVNYIGEKVIKLPTKRILRAFDLILDDYLNHREAVESFNQYYYRTGKKHFYYLLRELAEMDSLTEEEFRDWGQPAEYVQAIGVGECAGAALDVIGSIFGDAEQRLTKAVEALEEGYWAGAIYYSYNALVITAKAMLLAKDQHCNTHAGIIEDFQEHYGLTVPFVHYGDFTVLAGAISNEEPTESFALRHYETARAFLHDAHALRQQQLQGHKDQLVITEYYKA